MIIRPCRGGARVTASGSTILADVGTIESYWQANMDLLEERPQLDLYDLGLAHPHPVRGACRGEDRPHGECSPEPRQSRMHVVRPVEHSILSPGVRIDPGWQSSADSIVMGDTVIRAGAIVDRAIHRQGRLDRTQRGDRRRRHMSRTGRSPRA